jgi:hypothetical protein
MIQLHGTPGGIVGLAVSLGLNARDGQGVVGQELLRVEGAQLRRALGALDGSLRIAQPRQGQDAAPKGEDVAAAEHQRAVEEFDGGCRVRSGSPNPRKVEIERAKRKRPQAPAGPSRRARLPPQLPQDQRRGPDRRIWHEQLVAQQPLTMRPLIDNNSPLPMVLCQPDLTA